MTLDGCDPPATCCVNPLDLLGLGPALIGGGILGYIFKESSPLSASPGRVLLQTIPPLVQAGPVQVPGTEDVTERTSRPQGLSCVSCFFVQCPCCSRPL